MHIKELMLMKGLTRLPLVLTAFVAGVAALPTQADAGPRGTTYSCKRDKSVDAPMGFVFSGLTPVRLHASAVGGSDRSGVIKPVSWILHDASGEQVDSFPQSVLAWTSANMLKEVNLEGLEPGGSYTLALTSQDWCGNLAVVKQSLTMPPASPESTAPELSAPTTVRAGLMGYSTYLIHLDVTDNTGIAKVTVMVDGKTITELRYGRGAGYRWWFDEYLDDNTQSTLEGPSYYISYPDEYKGSQRAVDVEVEDAYGNKAVSSAVIPL